MKGRGKRYARGEAAASGRFSLDGIAETGEGGVLTR
jgi:hypothetical protein